VVLVLGPPGGGKSTLTRRLLDAYGWDHFAVRPFIRREIEAQTRLGLRAKKFVDAGQWLPDEMVVGIIRSWVESRREHGAEALLIEGVPGNIAQSELMDEVLAGLTEPPIVVYVDAPDDVCIARATKRRVCEQCDGGVSAAPDPDDPTRCERCRTPLICRRDDELEAFASRLATHRRLFEATWTHYCDGRLIPLDGCLPPEKVARHAQKELMRLFGREGG
jgi:adenylate kinase